MKMEILRDHNSLSGNIHEKVTEMNIKFYRKPERRSLGTSGCRFRENIETDVKYTSGWAWIGFICPTAGIGRLL
jgi:hypothetical protein